MALERITEAQMDEHGVCAAPNILNGTPAENKALFDRMTRALVAPAVNACVDAVERVNEQQEVWEKTAREAAEAAAASENAAKRSEEKARLYAYGGTEEHRKPSEDGEGYEVVTEEIKGAKQYAEQAERYAVELGESVDAVKRIFEDLMYEPIDIIGFTHGGGAQEMGAAVSEVTLSWEINKTPVSLTLDGRELDPTKTQETLVYPPESPLTETTTWTLVAKDERGATDTRGVTLLFCGWIYYGAAAKPETVDRAFLQSLKGHNHGNTKNRTVKITGGEGLYAWYAYPKRLGKSLFTVGGFDYEYELETVPITNSLGYTEDYYVYRSGQYAPASLSVTVKDGG